MRKAVRVRAWRRPWGVPSGFKRVMVPVGGIEGVVGEGVVLALAVVRVTTLGV